METFSCEAILCVLGCVLIDGMIAFMVFNIWREEFGTFARLQIIRPKFILWKSHKKAVENNDETCFTAVSFITPRLPWVIL